MKARYFTHHILFPLLLLLLNFCSKSVYAQIPPYIPGGGLLAWYPFTSDILDHTWLGSDGVPHGPILYATDRFGTSNACYYVNGISMVTLPINNFPLGNSSRSVSVWFKYKLPYPGMGRPFIGWGGNSFGTSFALFAADTFIGLAYVNAAVKKSFTPDTFWHNMVITYPSTGGGSAAIKLYFDGALAATNTINPIGAFNTTTGAGTWPGMAGSQYYLPAFTDSWTGWMDDVGVWNRELTPCEVYQIYTATINFTPTISGASNICLPGSTTLTTTISGGVWSSSNPLVASVTGGVVTAVSAGNTIITYSLTNVCGTFSDTMMETVGTIATVSSITGPANICIGSPVTLLNATAGGIWTSSNPGVAAVGSTTGIVSGLTTGTAIISYTITNACGTATDTQMVVVNAMPSVGSITGISSFCAGISVTMSNPVTGGIWTSSNPGVATVGGTLGVVTGITSGNTIITYSITNFCGTASDTQAITIYALPFAGSITGPSSLCAGTSITLTDAATGGVWSSSNPSVATIGSSSGITAGLTAGVTLISYSATNICGSATDTQTIVVYPSPNAGDITGNAILCLGATISLTNTVSGGIWSSTNTAVATINGISGFVTPLTAGTTLIIYTPALNVYGCTDSTSFLLTVNSLAVSSTTAPIKCNGDANGGLNVTVTNGSGSYQYSWSNGSTSSFITGLTSGVYTVVINDLGTNCTDTQSFNLVMPGVLDIESTTQNDLCNLGRGNINLVNIWGGVSPYTYLWSTGATTSNITGLVSGDYTVKITDNNLCTKQFVLSVGEDDCNDVLIHDAITPNGDGKNDVWVIEGINRYPGNTVQVFDKWGDIVLDAHNYNNDWSGQGKSGLLPDGTYFYLIKLNATNLSADKNIMTGSLLIKR